MLASGILLAWVGTAAAGGFAPMTTVDETVINLPREFGNYTIDDLESAGSCGTVMASFGGVNAYSNGANQGTGSSCAGSCDTGSRYQCVEYVQRYMHTKHGTPGIWPVSYASQMCNAHPSGISRTSNPSPGDAVVFSWGSYGHTAIVTEVSGGSINVIEQNASPSGKNTYSISSASCFLTAGGGDGPCHTRGYYCGNDKLGLSANALYYCSGAGAQPSLAKKCAMTCVTMPQGTDDVCSNTGSCAGMHGWYCGSDRVNGDYPQANYYCANGSGGGAKYCSNGCHTAPKGQNDYCN